ESKAYKTYLGYATGSVPPKVSRKFKKASQSKKDSVPVPADEEHVQKGKRVINYSNYMYRHQRASYGNSVEKKRKGGEQENDSEEHESEFEQDTDGSESDSESDQQDGDDEDDDNDDDKSEGDEDRGMDSDDVQD
nr:hypothetical protein [Tanacetum cinerariifolium]